MNNEDNYSFFGTIFSTQIKAQNLTGIEQVIISKVDEQMPLILDQLKEVVNINSCTSNIEGVKKVGSFFQKELEKIGFVVNWVVLPDSLKRAGHLFAFHKGKKGKRILLLGHMDTVFDLDQPFKPFSILGDSAATGQGVVEMKGGDIIMLASLQSL